jgi:hypothetical protein
MRLVGRLAFVATPMSLLMSPPAQPASGPELGSGLHRVEVYAPTGPRAGSTFDAAQALGTGPAALLFVGEISRNVAPMVRGLDRLASEYGLLGFASFTVFLADDRTAAENQLERSSPALGLRNPMVLSVDGRDGPGSYGINRKCTLTLVLADGGRVVRSVGYTDTGAQDVPQLEAWIAELTGPMPRDATGLRELLARRYPGSDQALLELTASLLLQVRRQEENGARMAGANSRRERAAPRPAEATSEAGKPREGKAPQDERLRNLLRAVIQQAATPADLDAAFEDIDARVGDDKDLEQQAIDMFKLVLSLGYGTDDARTRCKSWLALRDKRGEPGGGERK